MVLRTLPPKVVRAIRQTYQKYADAERPAQSKFKRFLHRTITPRKKAEDIIPQRIMDFFLRRKNADYRTQDSVAHRTNANQYGYRVRKMRIRGVGTVIIKKVHYKSASELITILRKIVDDHNTATKGKKLSYVLKKPIGYPIGEHFIAMSEANLPSILEMFEEFKSKNADNLIDKIANETLLTEETIIDQLTTAMRELTNNGTPLRRKYLPNDFYAGNILVAGYKNGKFIFVPLMDIE